MENPMTKSTDLHDYFRDITLEFLKDKYKYKEHQPSFSVNETSDATKILFTAQGEEKEKFIEVRVTISHKVKLIPCEPTLIHPYHLKLEGYVLETSETSEDDREGTVIRKMEDGARFFMPNLPFLKPPRPVMK